MLSGFEPSSGRAGVHPLHYAVFTKEHKSGIWFPNSELFDLGWNFPIFEKWHLISLLLLVVCCATEIISQISRGTRRSVATSGGTAPATTPPGTGQASGCASRAANWWVVGVARPQLSHPYFFADCAVRCANVGAKPLKHRRERHPRRLNLKRERERKT